MALVRPNIHYEHYMTALAAKRAFSFSEAEVTLLRDVYQNSIAPDERAFDIYHRIDAARAAIKNAHRYLGVDIKV